MPDPDLDNLRVRFIHFLTETQEQVSPLYEEITRHIVDDSEVLTIAAEVRRPPEPNMLFAVVHSLLMDHPRHPLSAYYGSLSEDPRPPTGVYPRFRDFLFAHRSEAIALLRTRITQTNEVRRCAYLLPAFSHIYESARHRPLALIDIGCSAGLHLLWDRYRYDYGFAQCGDPDAPTLITCEVRGEKRPPVPATLPQCEFRLGIDLNPVDFSDATERRWLEALVWPEHAHRRRLMNLAITQALDNPPSMIRGDATEILGEHLPAVPADTTLVVYHCHALCQAKSEELDVFRRVLEEYSHRRPIYLLSAEGYRLEVRMMFKGDVEPTHLANKDPHGQWVEWLAESGGDPNHTGTMGIDRVY